MSVRRHVPFALLAAGAVTAAGLVWLVLPRDKELASLWEFLAKLVPFVLAAEAIARLEAGERARRWLAAAAVPATFLVFFVFFVPKVFFHAEDTATLYYLMLTLTPFVILALALAHRLGGGQPGTTRRLAYGMLLLMVSGIEDLAFLTINPHTDPRWTPIPERWTWPSHMIVRLGHAPTKYEAYAFIGVHLVLAGLVLFLPSRVARTWLTRIPARRLLRPSPDQDHTLHDPVRR